MSFSRWSSLKRQFPIFKGQQRHTVASAQGIPELGIRAESARSIVGEVNRYILEYCL
jgi:hypothetical protein